MDLDKFIGDKFKPREIFVNFRELRPYFDDEVNAAVDSWKKETGKKKIPDEELAKIEAETVGLRVRSLTGQEIGQARKAAEGRKDLVAIADAFLSGAPSKIRDSIREMYGDAEVSDDDALHINVLATGMTYPDVQQGKRMDFLLKLYKYFPADFRYAAIKVLLLTGQGHQPGKP